MKKYFNKKRVMIFLFLVVLATLLSAYLNAIGYKGMLYFQTVYDRNGHKTYGNFSPRTGGFLVTGSVIVYLSMVWRTLNQYTENLFIRRAIGSLLIIGVTIFSIGVIDLVNALIFIVNR